MASARGLNELAKLYGVQTAYEDVSKKRRTASRQALLRILQIMGAQVEKLDDVPAAIERRQAWLRERMIEPVIVAWNGWLPDISLTVQQDLGDRSVQARLVNEAGDETVLEWQGSDLPPSFSSPDNSTKNGYVTKLPCRKKLPLGYHQLRVLVDGHESRALVIAAPRRIQTGSLVTSERDWGLFAPMYSLHGGSGWGGGSIAEFDEFASWVRSHGGTLVASLPLLASFYENPWDISPYSPASRLFWNEFFIDLARVPEAADLPEARQIIESSDFQQQLSEMRGQKTVRHAQLMGMKRRVLEKVAAEFFRSDSPRRTQFEQYRTEKKDLDAYATFRAACEQFGRPWTRWDEQFRQGHLPPDAVKQEVREYFLYAQWLAHEQFEQLSKTASDKGMTWYLDLPLGTHPDGYDVWRYRDVFAVGASGGAPPDAFFTRGQSWGFPPFDPNALRESHYEYFIQVIRHHLRQARLLRIDHVMGLHRLWWVPDGEPASSGVYVRYPAEELYAVLLLEAHRHGASIIGENLGTVPSYVNTAMKQHGLGRLYVMQYEMHLPTASGVPRSPDADEVASLNTHDMPPFATWWQGKDIDDRRDLELMDDAQAETERVDRERLRQLVISMLRDQGALEGEATDLPAILRASLKWLAASDSSVMLVNLEDLWYETQSQNVPGTVSERVNWQRKTRLSLDEFKESPEVLALLREIDSARKAARPAEKGVLEPTAGG